MSGDSKIEWTDATWNPVRGCDKISPGCKNCYAETFAERFRGVKGHPYEQGFDFRLAPDKLEEPLRWKKPRKVFVNSMSDLFHKETPDDYLDHVFGVMALAGQHTFQILTKRADRLPGYLGGLSLARLEVAVRKMGRTLHYQGAPLVEWPLPNVWLGVSVENQEYADARIPHLLRTPAAVRFLSCEPLLEAVEFRPSWVAGYDYSGGLKVTARRIDWVIVGGESGAGARPFGLAWARSIVEQCKAASVPVFVKQLGANPVRQTADDVFWNIGISRKGGDPAEWPEDLRVREYPR